MIDEHTRESLLHLVERSITAEKLKVTDTKLVDNPVILFNAEQWSAWQDEVTSDELTNANGCVEVTVDGMTWRVAAVDGSATLVFNGVEWSARRRAVLYNEFAN
jgi:hypothetical protein